MKKFNDYLKKKMVAEILKTIKEGEVYKTTVDYSKDAVDTLCNDNLVKTTLNKGLKKEGYKVEDYDFFEKENTIDIYLTGKTIEDKFKVV